MGLNANSQTFYMVNPTFFPSNHISFFIRTVRLNMQANSTEFSPFHHLCYLQCFLVCLGSQSDTPHQSPHKFSSYSALRSTHPSTMTSDQSDPHFCSAFQWEFVQFLVFLWRKQGSKESWDGASRRAIERRELKREQMQDRWIYRERPIDEGRILRFVSKAHPLSMENWTLTLFFSLF